MATNLERLRNWLRGQSLAVQSLEPLRGDVSPRRYVRVGLRDGGGAVAAIYPSSLADTYARYVATTNLLDRHGIPVPQILALDPERRFMLLEDVGSTSLYELGANWRRLTPHLELACELARRVRDLPHTEVADHNPPLDEALMWRELEQTWDLFLEPQGLIGPAPVAERLHAALAGLCRRLGEESPVPCHRDFMARNLMLTPSGRLVVLDHQDLRLGPPSYDVASLLNDTLFPPPALVRRLTDLDLDLVADGTVQSYRRAALQRTLKIVGTFTRFAAAGSRRYQGLVAPALRRALEHLKSLPETADLGARLQPLWSL